MSARMVRKQIYLPRRQNQMLKRLAKQRGISEAEVIRQALEREAEVTAYNLPGSAEAWQEVSNYVRERQARYGSAGAPVRWDRQELYAERENRPDTSKFEQ